MEAVPLFNKKEDPMPLLSPVGRRDGADVGGGGARSPTHPGNGRPDTNAGIPWGVLMQSSAVWAIVTNNFAFHYATYVLMSWLPTYFQSHIGVGLSDMSSWYTVRVCENMCLSGSRARLCCRPVSFAWRAERNNRDSVPNFPCTFVRFTAASRRLWPMSGLLFTRQPWKCTRKARRPAGIPQIDISQIRGTQYILSHGSVSRINSARYLLSGLPKVATALRVGTTSQASSGRAAILL